MSDLESTDWSEIAANNIQPSPAGWPPNSSPNIVYTTSREEMGAIKRDWNRRNAAVTSGGSANAQTLTYTVNPTALVRGQRYAFIAGFANTGPTTLAVGGLAAAPIVVNGTALVGGELKVGLISEVIYDGSSFQLIAGTGTSLPLAGGTLSGNIGISGPAANAKIFFGQTTGVNRWLLELGDGTAESGSNQGSNFQLQRFSDAGSYIDSPIAINRASGLVTTSQGLTVAGTTLATGGVYLNNTVASGSRLIIGQTTGSNRWQLTLGDTSTEGGSNTGSNFLLTRFNDAGSPIDFPITITRPDGKMLLSYQMAAPGYQCKPGLAGTYRGNFHNIDFTGTVPQLWIDNTNFGTFSFTSDYRTKRDVAALPSMWERIKKLKPVSYRQKDFDIIKADDAERWGFVAHELQEDLIEDAASGQKDEANLIQAVNPMTVIASLTKALQEAMARIEKLEARLPLAPETA